LLDHRDEMFVADDTRHAASFAIQRLGLFEQPALPIADRHHVYRARNFARVVACFRDGERRRETIIPRQHRRRRVRPTYAPRMAALVGLI